MTLEPSHTLALDAETWSTPALAPDRIVAADRSGRVRAWDAEGSVVWEVRLGAEITASPTLASLLPSASVDTRAPLSLPGLADPSGAPTEAGDATADVPLEPSPSLVLLGDHDGTFVALDLETGARRWARALGAKIRATAAVAEIQGIPDIWLPVYGPRLVRLAMTGRVVYDRPLPKNAIYHRGRPAGAVSSPLVADIDGDGRTEVVFGVRAQRVYCCDALSGEIRWFTPLRYDPDSSPTLAEIDGQTVVLVGGGEHTGGTGDNVLLALHPRDGRIQWTLPAGGGVDGAATVAEVEGIPTAFFCSLASASVIAGRTDESWRQPFGPTDDCIHDPICRPPGQPYFTGRAICRSYATPLVADVDGGGTPEVVAGSMNGTLLVMDAATGEVRSRLGTGGAIRGNAVLADIDGSGRCTMAVPSGDRVLIFPTDAPPSEAWPQFKGEPSHLGCREPRAVAPSLGPSPRLVRARLAWHSSVRDAARFTAFQVERRILNPLGVRIADHYY